MLYAKTIPTLTLLFSCYLEIPVSVDYVNESFPPDSARSLKIPKCAKSANSISKIGYRGN